MRKHSLSCQNCQGDVDASLLKTSFINTPQRSLTFSLINCSSTLSPSALMAIRLLRSTISSRPWRSALAVSHAVASSAAQGAISLPSTTSRRRRGLSTTEILNMRTRPRPSGSARHVPKGLSGNYWSFPRKSKVSRGALRSVNAVLTRIRRSRGDRCQTSSFALVGLCD